MAKLTPSNVFALINQRLFLLLMPIETAELMESFLTFCGRQRRPQYGTTKGQ
jgi:hypothetical protein